MSLFDAILLGLVQGITEFLPISSSGHLIIIRDWLGIGQEGGLTFDAILQLATALAALLYFRKDITRIVITFIRWISGRLIDETEKQILIAVTLGTIPAVVAGLFLEDLMETVFRSSLIVAIMLIIGSIVLFVAERVGKGDKWINGRKGLGIGLFQILALVPGFSRSGATISGGLFLGLTKVEATRFSFLLSIPILLGSGLKKLTEIGSVPVSSSLVALSAAIAFIVGLIAIDFLLKYVKHHTFSIFIIYRLLLSLVIIFTLV